MRLSLSSHATYRPSDSEWVDRLPGGWSEKRVKDLFMLVAQMAPQKHSYQLLSLFASIGVRPREEMEQRGNKAVTTEGYWIVKKGDIVVNKLLAWMGAIGLSTYDGVTSPAYDILRKKNQNLDERYFEYLFRTERSQHIFKQHSRGIMEVRLRLYFDKFGALTVPVPPFPEQRAIADYLDAKTAQIDRKIDLLTQKAAKYRQLKLSLISEAVTRGFDRSVPMKDSGIDWVRDIPVHWTVKRVKEIGRLVLGKMLDNVSGADKHHHNFLKSRNIGWLKVDVTDVARMYFSPAEMKLYRLAKGDLLLSEGGEVGKTSQWEGELEECYIQNSVHKLTIFPTNHARYFLYQSFLLGQTRYYDSIVNQVSIKHGSTTEDRGVV